MISNLNSISMVSFVQGPQIKNTGKNRKLKAQGVPSIVNQFLVNL